MKMEMTARDVILLKVSLTLLLLVLGVRFLVIPSIERLQSAKVEQENTQQIADRQQAKIDSIPSLEEQQDDLEKELEDLKAPYYGEMENQEIDRLLTGIALKYDLFPESMEIGERSKEAIPAYTYSQLAALEAVMAESEAAEETEETEETEEDPYAAAEAAGETGGDAALPPGTILTEGYLIQNPVRFSLRGDREDIMDFLDDLEKNYPSIQVDSFTVGDDIYLGYELEYVKKTVLDCRLIVLTCEEQKGEISGS